MADHGKIEGLYCRKYGIPFDVAVERIEDLLVRYGFRIFCVIDHKKAAAEYGIEMFPATVIIFGNPSKGTDLMKSAPLMAIDLPSRILVEDAGWTEACYNLMNYVRKRHMPETHGETASDFDARIISMLGEVE